MGGLRWLMLIALLGGTSANLVINGTFKEGFGWEVNYTWIGIDTQKNASELNITRNGENIARFEPKGQETQRFFTPTIDNSDVNITCVLLKTQSGSCKILVNVLENATDADFSGTLRWEGAKPEIETREKNIMANATKAIIKSTQNKGQRQVLNCSSTGVPYPTLKWTYGVGNETKEIKEDFNGTKWDNSTKLWHSFSVFKPSTNTEKYMIVCTPSQVNRKNETFVGVSDSYPVNSAPKLDFAGTITMAVLLALPFVLNETPSLQ